jgi:hypothetical protein
MRELTFVIMGEEYTLDADENLGVWLPRAIALYATRNTGRPPDDFQIRDDAGYLIHPNTYVRNLPEGRIWLSPAIGWGG